MDRGDRGRMNHGLNEPGAITLTVYSKIIQLSPAILNAHFVYLHFSRVAKSVTNSWIYKIKFSNEVYFSGSFNPAYDTTQSVTELLYPLYA